jgi:hypothetical protein
MSPRDIPYIHMFSKHIYQITQKKTVVLISHIFKNNMYQIIKPAQFF